MSNRVFALLLAVACCNPLQINAQVVPLQNPGFELPVLGDNGSAGVDAPLLGTNSTTISNWDMTASSLVAIGVGVPARAEILNPTGVGPVGITGSNIGVLRANGLLGAITGATMSQSVAQSYTANTRYTLTADVGVVNLADGLSTFGFRLKNGSNTLAERDHVFLLTILLNSNRLFPVSLTFDTNGTPPPGNIGVEFFEGSLISVGGTFIFDNVNLVATAIPEPGTIALLAVSGFGGATVFFYRRRQRLKQLNASV